MNLKFRIGYIIGLALLALPALFVTIWRCVKAIGLLIRLEIELHRRVWSKKDRADGAGYPGKEKISAWFGRPSHYRSELAMKVYGWDKL